MTTNAERSATFRERVSRTIRAALRSGAGIACIAGADITSQRRSAPMAITEPKQTRPSDILDAKGKIKAIGQLLGVSATDPEGMSATLLMLYFEPTQADNAAAKKLSTRELAMCAQKKIAPARYLASKSRGIR